MTTTAHADNRGVAIAYEVHRPGAAGTPVVLVHGLGYARWGWEPVVDRLGDRPVVLFDNRGIGASDVPEGPYTAEQMAGDVLAVMDAAGLGAVDLVGTSLGGMIAQEVALAAPERVRRLVLVASSPGGARAHPMPDVTRRLLERMPTMAPREALRAAVENACGPATRSQHPDVVDRVVAHRLAAPQDPRGWQAQAAAGTTYDGGDRLSGIAAPTLVVQGTADDVIDPRNADVLADLLPHATVAWVEGAGHLLFWERPDAFVAAVVDFLDDAADARRPR